MKASIYIEIKYDMSTATAREIREQLESTVESLYQLGRLSGDTEATVTAWKHHIELTQPT